MMNSFVWPRQRVSNPLIPQDKVQRFEGRNLFSGAHQLARQGWGNGVHWMLTHEASFLGY